MDAYLNHPEPMSTERDGRVSVVVATSGRPSFASQCATSPALPVWLRLSFLALERHGEKLEPGELRHALSPDHPLSPGQISRGISQAVDKGLLDSASSARALYVPGVES